jgi:hypothetical protein
VVGFTTGSRGKVPEKTREKTIRNNNNNNNNTKVSPHHNHRYQRISVPVFNLMGTKMMAADL